ncbi:MAG: efflux transporter outer membrane subunit [Amphritea sp.]
MNTLIINKKKTSTWTLNTEFNYLIHKSYLPACLALSIALSGCTKLGPDFVKPEAPNLESWSKTDAADIKKQAVDYSSWWNVFNDPILNQLVETSRKDNLTLQVAGLRILEARALLGIAIGDKYPQTQDVVAGYSFVSSSENAPNAAQLDHNYSRGRIGLDTAWELDFWGRFERGIEAANARLGATIADYDDIMIALNAQVSTTYVVIRELEERLERARENVAVQKRTLEIAQVRFRGGAVTELDVQQARALLRDTQALIPVLKTQLHQSRNALSVLLATPPNKLDTILGESGAIPQAPVDVAIGIPADLLRRRPDIRRAELDAAIQSARIGIAKADLYPRFTLVGFIGFEAGGGSTDSRSNNSSLNDIFDADSFTGSFGPSLRLPFFNYGRLKNNVRIQDARFQELAVNYQNTVLRAYQEVEDSLTGFLQSQDQTQFLSDSVKASKRSTDLALLQYRRGIVDYVRVLDSQRFLVNQQDRLAQSRSSIALNLIATYRALGGGWESRDLNTLVPDSMLQEMKARTDWGDLLPATDLEKAPQTGEEAGKTTVKHSPDW